MRCDHQCSGVLIPDADDTYWFLNREKPPPGWSGVGGHLDDHGGPETAARVESKEEMGITVVSLIPAFEEWFPNWCRRQPQFGGPGHYWHMYIAEWEGQPSPSPDEARGLRRLRRSEIQALAERTAAYAVGDLAADQFAASPGLELPWAYWTVRLGLVDLPRDVLVRITDRSTHPPGLPKVNGHRPH